MHKLWVQEGTNAPSIFFLPNNKFWLLSWKGADTKYKFFVNDYLDDAKNNNNNNPLFTGPRIEASELPVYRG
jgi:hypothetical protein